MSNKTMPETSPAVRRSRCWNTSEGDRNRSRSPQPRRFFFARMWACVHEAVVNYVPGVQTSLPK